MSTSQLAILAKTNPAYLGALWQAVYRLVTLWANKYASNGQGSRLYDTSDLVQSGYLALVDAVANYDPNTGAFTTYLRFHIRRHFAEVAGRRGTKRRPEVYAISLNEPINEGADVCHLDLLPDPEAHYAYADAMENLDVQRAHEAIQGEMAKLTPQQQQAITLHICAARTTKDTAAIMGCTASQARQHEYDGLRKLRATKTARQLAPDFRHVSLKQFKHTFTSSVEEVILQWERQVWLYEQQT